MKKLFQPRTLLFLGLAVLWLRNAPMAVLFPIWAHGDEIGHLDYTMKIGRGRIPRPNEYIEPAVFRLHKGHYDGRYISPHKHMSFVMPKDLGLAAYSYEAPQPPLPYLILAAFRFPMKAAGMPLLAQVRGLRLVCLLAVSVGLFVLYRALRRRTDLGLFWYAPLVFIPLLSQDMFHVLNTDVFAFLFGCGVVWAVFRLFERPAAAGRWAVMSAAVILSMWTKATCGFFFALWPILAIVLVIRTKNERTASGENHGGRASEKAAGGGENRLEENVRDGAIGDGEGNPGRVNFGFTAEGGGAKKRIAGLAALFFVAAAALSAPWYIRNSVRNSYVFGFQFNEKNDLSYNRYQAPPLRRKEALEFKNAFGHTLLRGEMTWKGAYLDGFPQPWNKILTEILFWIIFAVGLFAVFLPVSTAAKTSAGPYFVFAAAGAGLILSLFVLHFGWGGIPFYHARYAFAGLYPILLVFSGGCRRLIPEDRLALTLPALVLLVYNAAYTYRLVVRVLAP